MCERCGYPDHFGAFKLGAFKLYSQSAEIHACVRYLVDIADRYRRAAASAEEKARNELFEDLIQFFGYYDRMRSEQIESLKAQLIDALKWSVKPPLPAGSEPQ